MWGVGAASNYLPDPSVLCHACCHSKAVCLCVCVRVPLYRGHPRQSLSDPAVIDKVRPPALACKWVVHVSPTVAPRSYLPSTLAWGMVLAYREVLRTHHLPISRK